METIVLKIKRKKEKASNVRWKCVNSVHFAFLNPICFECDENCSTGVGVLEGLLQLSYFDKEISEAVRGASQCGLPSYLKY